jgi:hypothetical protein
MRRTQVLCAAGLLILMATTSGDPIAYEAARSVDLGVYGERAVVAHLNADDLPDFAMTGIDGNGVAVYLNNGDLTFTRLDAVLPDMWVWTITPGDVNGDGVDDLVATGVVGDPHDGPIAVIGSAGTGVSLFTNDGEGNLTGEVLGRHCEFDLRAALADIDGDGDLDIGYPTYWYDEPQGIHTLMNDGEGSFTPGLFIDTRISSEGSPIFGDLDGDGLPELRWSAIFPNLGNGEFGFEEPSKAGGSYIVDITEDGINDFVTSRGTVYKGLGNRRFASGKRYGELDNTGPSGLADLDGDGDLDFVVSSFKKCVSVLVNEGEGVFGRNHEYCFTDEDPGYVREVEAGDFDGDGRTDVLVVGTLGAWLLELGGETPPTILSSAPDETRGGERVVFTVTGEGFGPDTSLDFGPGNEVADLVLESPERIQATVDLAPLYFDQPENNGGARHDVIVENPSRGGSRIRDAFHVDAYWDLGIDLKKGRSVDSQKPGRDRFKVRGKWFKFHHADELMNQEAPDLRLVFGSPLEPYELAVPGDDPGWEREIIEGHVRRIAWESPEGASPRIRLVLKAYDRRKWEFNLKARDIDFPGPQSRSVWLELYLGDKRAAGGATWKRAGKGRFRR